MTQYIIQNTKNLQQNLLDRKSKYPETIAPYGTNHVYNKCYVKYICEN